MRKKIIISLVCLLSFLGITAYCFVNSKTDDSEQVTEVSKQEVKTVKKTIKSEDKKDADGNKTNAVSKQPAAKEKVQKHPPQAKIRLHHKIKQTLLLKIQTIRVKRKHWTILQPTNLIQVLVNKK